MLMISKNYLKAYLEHNTLTAATDFSQRVFKDQGLVIIDGDDAAFKKCFIPYLK